MKHLLRHTQSSSAVKKVAAVGRCPDRGRAPTHRIRSAFSKSPSAKAAAIPPCWPARQRSRLVLRSKGIQKPRHPPRARRRGSDRRRFSAFAESYELHVGTVSVRDRRIPFRSRQQLRLRPDAPSEPRWRFIPTLPSRRELAEFLKHTNIGELLSSGIAEGVENQKTIFLLHTTAGSFHPDLLKNVSRRTTCRSFSA